MSRSAVNYKYINKYGASNEATSSSSYYVTCVRVSVCACALCGLLCVASVQQEQ